MSARPPPELAVIVCEIIAPRAALAAALTEIAAACARDVGQAITLKTLRIGSTKEPVLTLHLPAEVAASQHKVWCLACRLACFCPDVRVSVLVRGENSFGQKSTDISHRQRRSA